MPWTSRAPSAITNLITALNAEAELDGVYILDGPTVTSATISEAITVGFTDENNTDAVSARLSSEGMAVKPNREMFTINCAVHVFRGDTAVSAARERAYVLLSGVGAALASDHTLSRSVMSAMLSEHTLSQTQTAKGILAELRFGVDCDAYTGR